MAKSLRPLIEPRLVVVAEVDGKAVGIALGLPDYNEAFKLMAGRLRHALALLSFQDAPPARALGPFARLFGSRRMPRARMIAHRALPEITPRGEVVGRQ